MSTSAAHRVKTGSHNLLVVFASDTYVPNTPCVIVINARDEYRPRCVPEAVWVLAGSRGVEYSIMWVSASFS